MPEAAQGDGPPNAEDPRPSIRTPPASPQCQAPQAGQRQALRALAPYRGCGVGTRRPCRGAALSLHPRTARGTSGDGLREDPERGTRGPPPPKTKSPSSEPGGLTTPDPSGDPPVPGTPSDQPPIQPPRRQGLPALCPPAREVEPARTWAFRRHAGRCPATERVRPGGRAPPGVSRPVGAGPRSSRSARPLGRGNCPVQGRPPEPRAHAGTARLPARRDPGIPAGGCGQGGSAKGLRTAAPTGGWRTGLPPHPASVVKRHQGWHPAGVTSRHQRRIRNPGSPPREEPPEQRGPAAT